MTLHHNRALLNDVSTISDFESFCQMLLRDPERALKQGYMGQSFAVSPEDAALIISINARSLPDLARKVVGTLSH